MILKAPTQTELISEIQTVLPAYTGGRYSVRFNTDKEIITEQSENAQSPSGWRADVIEMGQEILEPATYDEQGNLITEAVKGDYQYEVRLPQWMDLDSGYEVIDPEKQPLKALKRELKAENEQLKEENKRLKKRISEATDFSDLKTKITKIENSETSLTPWSDKLVLLEGEYTEHKNIVYITLSDHTASKDAEPANTPTLYEPV